MFHQENTCKQGEEVAAAVAATATATLEWEELEDWIGSDGETKHTNTYVDHDGHARWTAVNRQTGQGPANAPAPGAAGMPPVQN